MFTYTKIPSPEFDRQALQYLCPNQLVSPWNNLPPPRPTQDTWSLVDEMRADWTSRADHSSRLLLPDSLPRLDSFFVVPFRWPRSALLDDRNHIYRWIRVRGEAAAAASSLEDLSNVVDELDE